MPIRFTKSPLTPFPFNGVSDTIHTLAPPSHNHYHHHLTTIITTIILSLSLSSIPSSSSTMEKLWRPALKSIFLSPPKPSPSAIITAFSSSSRCTLTTLSSLSVFLSPASNFASSKTLNPSKPSSFLLLFCRDCRCFSSVSPLDTNRFEWNGPISCSEVVDAVSFDDTDENGDVDTRAASAFFFYTRFKYVAPCDATQDNKTHLGSFVSWIVRDREGGRMSIGYEFEKGVKDINVLELLAIFRFTSSRPTLPGNHLICSDSSAALFTLLLRNKGIPGKNAVMSYWADRILDNISRNFDKEVLIVWVPRDSNLPANALANFAKYLYLDSRQVQSADEPEKT